MVNSSTLLLTFNYKETIMIKKKFKTRQERGLGKYDAPLSLQYNQGFSAFKRNKNNPFGENTMQAREWQRGYNVAYFVKLERVKDAESRRRSEKIHAR